MIGKIAIPLALAAGLLTTASDAEARDGCGPGFHRGYYGWCRPNLVYRPYAYGPFYRPWRGYRWHSGYHWRRFGWHGGHRWGGFRHAGWRGGWHGGWHHRW
ncbi:GCG_CRPN prefix-to-repeats domain-containing protein [Methylorubrum populi]